MTRSWKAWLAALAVAGGGFVYGVLVGHYHVFPYYRLVELRALLRSEEPPPVYTAASPSAVAVVETALQRLLVKRVPLPNGSVDFSGGGAISGAGDVLFAITRGGGVLGFDLAGRTALESRADSLPMRWPDLMRSDLRHIIRLPWFRVAGAYAEDQPDGSVLLFVSHNVFHAEEECITANLSRARVTVTDRRLETPDGWETIFTSHPCLYPEEYSEEWETYGVYAFSGHISGGSIIPFDDERLLVSVGDYTYDGYVRDAYARDLSTSYGKILLVDRRSGADEIYTYGHRNPMGLHRDGDGVIWATEIGPQEGDELNRLVRGTDYGWPDVSYGINYGTTPWPLSDAQGRHGGYTEPVLAWVPGIAPTNLVRIEAERGAFSVWTNDLVLGSLKDQSLRRVRVSDGGRVMFDERIPMQDRIRDMVVLDDGTLVLLADGSGRLVFVADGGPVYEELSDDVMARILDLELYEGLVDRSVFEAGTVLDGEAVFTQRCSGCHSLDGRSSWGPHLSGVLSREIGSVDGFDYSFQLESDDRRWSPELLKSFILDPQTEFPDTRMPRVPISEADADSVAAYLQRRGN